MGNLHQFEPAASFRPVVPPNRALFMRKDLGVLNRAAGEVPSCASTLDFAHVGNMRIGRFSSDRRCELRHPLAIKRDAPCFLMIVVQLKGCSTYVQHGRAMRLEPGTWCVCDVPQPCVSEHDGEVEQLHFLIPRDAVRLELDLRFVFGRTFGGGGVSQLMFQAISSLYEQLPTLDPRRAEELAEVAQRLFQICALERVEQTRNLTVPEEMRDRIRACVEARLRDPRLSLDLIAAELDCTKRYLHMAFAGQPQTLSEYIWSRRLECSRADLENPALFDRPITEIAMSWGFNNLSHFSRAFRERFGLPPRAARSAALVTGAATT